MKNILIKATILASFIFIGLSASAQILPPPQLPPPGGTNVPLDPFSWVLLGAGGAYAIKRYRDGKLAEK